MFSKDLGGRGIEDTAKTNVLNQFYIEKRENVYF